MTKTNFYDGTPIVPDFLNKINNPTYSENPSEDGELPLPPLADASSQGLPVNYFLNSCMCGKNTEDGISTFYFTGIEASQAAICAGLRVSPLTANAAGTIVANSAGDPQVGFWAWNVAGNAPQIGDSFEYFTDVSHNLMGGVYNATNGEIQDTEITYQVEVKNNASLNGGGSASSLASLEVTGLQTLIDNGIISVLESSDPVELSVGSSVFLWFRFKILKQLSLETSRSINPSIKFESLGAGNYRHEIRSICVFSGNTFGKKLRPNNDRDLASVISWYKSENNTKAITPLYEVTGDEIDVSDNVTIQEFSVKKMPDGTFQTAGKITLVSPFSGTRWGSISGNPLGLTGAPGEVEIYFLGLEMAGDEVIRHVVWYELDTNTTSFHWNNILSGNWNLNPRLVAPTTPKYDL